MKSHKLIRSFLAVILCVALTAGLMTFASSAAYNKDFVSETHDVFKSTSSTLAPGVEQYINYAYAKDGNQMVYYVATADITRDDVVIQTSYLKQHENGVMGMEKLTNQIAYANQKYSNPNDEQYISEYYNVVAGVNASFYNMTTGQPIGITFIDGVSFGTSSYDNFFAILKDGKTAVIDYSKNLGKYVDENGEYQGYDVYFANRIGEDLGVKVNFVSTEAANRIEYLQTGKVDVILANFTVTPERAEEVDFAAPYMNVALGVVSKDDNVITTLDNWNADDSIIVISGTTAETYLIANYPDIPLQKFDSYATAKEAFENGTSVAWANDNTEVIAFALQNEGYTVGIPSLGSADTIAPAVSKGNTTLLDWINDEIASLGEENFFHADYEATLADTYGLDYEDSLVVEGGKVTAQ